jgi:hypothetical protein
MASEQADGLPDELDAWVAERAAATGDSRPEVLRQLLAAHRLLDEHPELLDGDGSTTVAVDDTMGPKRERSEPSESLAADLDDIESRLTALEADLDEKITDVRERVIQVKREADAKAPADHDHPEISRRMTEGFENYEEVLEYLADLGEDHEDKLRRLAGAVVDLRERVIELEQRSNERAAAAELRREANRQGITSAECGSCGSAVQIGLLDGPRCPHCEATFEELDPKRGFFGANTLTVGQRPALAAGTEPTDRTSPFESTDGDGSTGTDAAESSPDDTDETLEDATADSTGPFTFEHRAAGSDTPESEATEEPDQEERDRDDVPDEESEVTDR